jgi:hypothetical protein
LTPWKRNASSALLQFDQGLPQRFCACAFVREALLGKDTLDYGGQQGQMASATSFTMVACRAPCYRFIAMVGNHNRRRQYASCG